MTRKFPKTQRLEVTSASRDEMSAGNCPMGPTCKVQGTCASDGEKLLLLFRSLKLNWMIMMQIHMWWEVGHPHHSRFGRQVKVSGFDGTKSDDAKTATEVLGYVDPGTGDKYMLVVHQAILVPKMTVDLLGLLQLRNNGLKVNDESKHMVLNPMDDHYCIIKRQVENTIMDQGCYPHLEANLARF